VHSAGDFSVDLVAENDDGGTVIIDNQLEEIIMTALEDVFPQQRATD